MNFKKAFECMLDGIAVRLPEWTGFWCLENGTIYMCCASGAIVDIRDSKDMLFTLCNMASDDWVIADDVHIEELFMCGHNSSLMGVVKIYETDSVTYRIKLSNIEKYKLKHEAKKRNEVSRLKESFKKPKSVSYSDDIVHEPIHPKFPLEYSYDNDGYKRLIEKLIAERKKQCILDSLDNLDEDGC